MNKRAVFLDRDGVINRAVVRDGLPYPPADVAGLEILPGVERHLRRLKELGFVLIVVTNQPDVARGTMKRERVEEMNSFLAARLPIDRFITCFHTGSDNCDCRKPKPGMLIAGAREYGIDLTKSYMVGDRWRDIEAGQAAGCKSVFIDYGYAEKQPTGWDFCANTAQDALAIIEKEKCNEEG